MTSLETLFQLAQNVSFVPSLSDKKVKKNRRGSKGKVKLWTQKIDSETFPIFLFKTFEEKYITRPGYTRLMYRFPKSYYSPWLYGILTTFPRTTCGWYNIYNLYTNKRITGLPCANTATLTNPNPFLHNKHIAEHIMNLIYFNKKLTSLMLQCIQHRLLAKMDKRIVGEEDLYTLLPIPAHSLVAVYDFKTGSRYHFHTNTIMRIVLSALIYSTYGIPHPHCPKNPYTNLDWTEAQIMSIVQQIIINMTKNHRIPPTILLKYYKCNYNMGKFQILCQRELGIHAATEYFKTKNDPDVRETYQDTVEDLSVNMGIPVVGWIVRQICDRTLPSELQNGWDDLILSYWIYVNLHFIHGPYKNYEAICQSFILLSADTRKLLNARRNRGLRIEV